MSSVTCHLHFILSTMSAFCRARARAAAEVGSRRPKTKCGGAIGSPGEGWSAEAEGDGMGRWRDCRSMRASASHRPAQPRAIELGSNGPHAVHPRLLPPCLPAAQQQGRKAAPAAARTLHAPVTFEAAVFSPPAPAAQAATPAVSLSSVTFLKHASETPVPKWASAVQHKHSAWRPRHTLRAGGRAEGVW